MNKLIEKLNQYGEQVKADLLKIKAEFSAEEETVEEVAEDAVEETEEVAEEVALEAEVELMEDEEVPAEEEAPADEEVEDETPEFVTPEALAEALAPIQAQIDQIAELLGDMQELSKQVNDQVLKLSKAPVSEKISTEEKFQAQVEKTGNKVKDFLLRNQK